MTTAIITARLSVVSSEQSVSIERQLKAGHEYCASKEWEVVGEFVDDGVSASKVAPWNRSAFARALELPEHYDVVVAWSLDRFTRSLTDFLELDRRLAARGAAAVTIKDSIDMSTDMGRMIATILAIFAEYEAAQIRDRVNASRAHMIQQGRRPSGTPPYGWTHVPHPEGGWKVAQDAQTIEWVRVAVSKAKKGSSAYAIAKHLDKAGAPVFSWKGKARSRRESVGWSPSSVMALLTNPTLAGMTAYKGDVLRGSDGMPIISEGIGIMTPAERRDMMELLTTPRLPGKGEVAPVLLSGLVKCGECRKPLTRAKRMRKDGNTSSALKCKNVAGCPGLHRGAGLDLITGHVIERLLGERGHVEMTEVVRTSSADAHSGELGDIGEALDHISFEMRQTNADRAALRTKEDVLLARRDALILASDETGQIIRFTHRSVNQAWAAAVDDVAAQREVLLSQLDSLVFDTSTPAYGKFRPERVEMQWKPDPGPGIAISGRRLVEVPPEDVPETGIIGGAVVRFGKHDGIYLGATSGRTSASDDDDS